MSREAFREAARDQRVCAVTGEGGRAFHAHHVVRPQDVPDGVDADDTRNALRVQWQVHLDHHWSARKRIHLIHLTDENFEFAFEVLGDHAAQYLRDRYEGEDPRVTNRLLQSEVT